jgi:hypothetical protein
MKVQGPLDELAVFYCTPAKSGVYVTKSELIALARASDASLRVSERAWMLADILKSSATPAALADQVDRLRAFAERSLADHERIVATSPAAGRAMAPWIERARATIERLTVLAAEIRL